MTWSMPFISTLQQANIASIAGNAGDDFPGAPWAVEWLKVGDQRNANKPSTSVNGCRYGIFNPIWKLPWYSQWIQTEKLQINRSLIKLFRWLQVWTQDISSYFCCFMGTSHNMAYSCIILRGIYMDPQWWDHIPVSFPYCASSGQSRWGLHRDGLASFTHSLID